MLRLLSALVCVLALVGCSRERSVSFRSAPVIPSGVAVDVDIIAKPSQKPSVEGAVLRALTARNVGIADKASGVLTVRLQRWERADDADRLIFETFTSAGGPVGRDRQLHLAPAFYCVLQADIRRPDGSTLAAAAKVSARAHAHPDPTQRRTDGRFLLDGTEEVHPIAGDDASLLAAVLEQAAKELAGELVTYGPVVTLPLRDDPVAEEFLDLAQQGDFVAALEGILAIEADMSADRLFNVGALLDAQGQHAEALEWYGRSLALEPNDELLLIIEDCETRVAHQVVVNPI